MLQRKSSYEDVNKDVLLPNVKLMLSNLICNVTKMNLLHRFPWQWFSVGKSIFGQENSLQSKYYCFGGKEDVMQNNIAVKHAYNFLVTTLLIESNMCQSINHVCILTIRNVGIRFMELEENVRVWQNQSKTKDSWIFWKISSTTRI